MGASVGKPPTQSYKRIAISLCCHETVFFLLRCKNRAAGTPKICFLFLGFCACFLSLFEYFAAVFYLLF
jgi:hypothetical protein